MAVDDGSAMHGDHASRRTPVPVAFHPNGMPVTIRGPVAVHPDPVRTRPKGPAERDRDARSRRYDCGGSNGDFDKRGRLGRRSGESGQSHAQDRRSGHARKTLVHTASSYKVFVSAPLTREQPQSFDCRWIRPPWGAAAVGSSSGWANGAPAAGVVASSRRTDERSNAGFSEVSAPTDIGVSGAAGAPDAGPRPRRGAVTSCHGNINPRIGSLTPRGFVRTVYAGIFAICLRDSLLRRFHTQQSSCVSSISSGGFQAKEALDGISEPRLLAGFSRV